MWCKMADTKNIWLHILKDEKCMLYEENPFCVRVQKPFVSVDKKMIPLIMNGMLEMSWFVHIFHQN